MTIFVFEDVMIVFEDKHIFIFMVINVDQSE